MIDMLRSRIKLLRLVRASPTIIPGMTMSTAAVRDPTFFLGNGEAVDKQQFLNKITQSSARVICIGENHDDVAAHTLELDILRELHSNQAYERLALSLEFYDRECQTVMDEYVKGVVPLDSFLSDSKPPANHTDYQPLIDFCKDNGGDVIAANCPRRYTRLVGKGGRSSLDLLAGTPAVNLLPPLPYAAASQQYTDNFINIMKSMGNTNPTVPTNMLDAQSLWDATMADSIAGALHRADKIVHVTGYFHIQHGLGTIEHLHRYSPDLEVLTVVILPSEELDSLNEDQVNIGHLVALTDINAL